MKALFLAIVCLCSTAVAQDCGQPQYGYGYGYAQPSYGYYAQPYYAAPRYYYPTYQAPVYRAPIPSYGGYQWGFGFGNGGFGGYYGQGNCPGGVCR